MPVQYVDFEDARERGGLRMVVVPGVPSPWGEAAKGILHVKQIPWVAVKLDQANAALIEWSGQRSGPVAIYDDEAPRGGWAEILLLAERQAPKPALLPSDAADRALVMGLSHEICGEMGLGWCRRNQGVHSALAGGEGFPTGIAKYLAGKYGYRPGEGELYQTRVIGLLQALAARLHAQRSAGSRFYVGSSLTAVDIYAATFSLLFKLLPREQCEMIEPMRIAYESMNEATARALDPILIEHRNAIFAEFMELPLSL